MSFYPLLRRLTRSNPDAKNRLNTPNISEPLRVEHPGSIPHHSCRLQIVFCPPSLWQIFPHPHCYKKLPPTASFSMALFDRLNPPFDRLTLRQARNHLDRLTSRLRPPPDPNREGKGKPDARSPEQWLQQRALSFYIPNPTFLTWPKNTAILRVFPDEPAQRPQ